jgi:hypothetical protein
MTRDELIDCINVLGDKHLFKVAEEHWIGCLTHHLTCDDEQGIELNQISINNYWVNCPLHFLNFDYLRDRIGDYALKYDLTFSRLANTENFLLEYRDKDGRLIANEEFPRGNPESEYYWYYNEGYEILKSAIIYLEIRELYIILKYLLPPDLLQYCILLYCDSLANIFPRNTIIK